MEESVSFKSSHLLHILHRPLIASNVVSGKGDLEDGSRHPPDIELRVEGDSVCGQRILLGVPLVLRGEGRGEQVSFSSFGAEQPSTEDLEFTRRWMMRRWSNEDDTFPYWKLSRWI